ncbi:unnamed protein product [Choristocarpus tenellus]
MFLGAVARPRKLSNRITQHSSKHCPKVTKVFLPATVDRERYKKLMLMMEDVILAIKAACLGWKDTSSCSRTGQTHTPRGGIMKAIWEAPGDDIVIETQPTNSPDLNIKDLGLFHSIQQLKEDIWVNNMEELVEATMEVFNV